MFKKLPQTKLCVIEQDGTYITGYDWDAHSREHCRWTRFVEMADQFSKTRAKELVAVIGGRVLLCKTMEPV